MMRECNVKESFTLLSILCKQNSLSRERIHDFEPLSDRVQDDILTVSAQLEQVHFSYDPISFCLTIQYFPDAATPTAGTGRFALQRAGDHLNSGHGAI